MRLTRQGLTLPSDATWQTGQVRHDTWLWLPIILLIAAAQGACSSDMGFQPPPIGYSGTIGERYRTRAAAEEPRQHTNQVDAFIDLRSFIWQPWFITVDGGMDVAHEIERGGTSGSSDSLLLGGDVSLSVLPLSRYPTTLSYSHTDSQFDGAFGGTDFVRDRFSLNSSQVIASGLRTFLSADYETIDQPGFGNENRQQVNFGLDKAFERDRLGFNLEYRASDFDSELDRVASVVGESNQETDLLARINYDSTPLANLTTQTTSSAIYSTEDGDTLSEDEISLQGTTTAQWRPPSAPYSVNGALRTLAETIDTSVTDSGTKTDRLLTNGTVGLNYPINRELTTNFGLTTQVEKEERESQGPATPALSSQETTHQTNAIGNVSYQSVPRDLYGFSWRWDGSGALNLGYGSERDFEDTETGSLGHSFLRTLDWLILSPVQFSFSEQALVRRTPEEGVTPSLFHSANLTHRSADDGVARFAGLFLSDRRDIAVSDADEFQLARLQLDRRSSLDVRRQWFASLSIQATRQSTAGSKAEFTSSADGTLSYSEQDIFQVTDLSFLSELTLSVVELEEFFDEDQGTIDTEDDLRSEWRNILEYRIGRVFASLEATIFVEDEGFGNLFMVRLRRDFGGVF